LLFDFRDDLALLFHCRKRNFQIFKEKRRHPKLSGSASHVEPSGSAHLRTKEEIEKKMRIQST